MQLVDLFMVIYIKYRIICENVFRNDELKKQRTFLGSGD